MKRIPYGSPCVKKFKGLFHETIKVKTEKAIGL
jgi:hypothetical protein